LRKPNKDSIWIFIHLLLGLLKGIGLSSSSFFESLNFVDGFKGENQEVGLVFTDTISGRTFFSNSSVFPELPVFELHSSIDRWSFHFTLPRKSSIFLPYWVSLTTSL